jgi:hypothetical protein
MLFVKMLSVLRLWYKKSVISPRARPRPRPPREPETDLPPILLGSDAACVVNIGPDIQEAVNYLGGIVYYPQDDGCYMLVDVAYANRLGQAGSNPTETSQLLEGNKFIIQDWITLEDAYKRSGF